MTQRLRRSRYAALAAVAALLVAIVVGGWRWTSTSDGAPPQRVSDNKGATHMQTKSLALNGIDLEVPPGWDSESFVNASGMTVLRVGSFSFPHAPNDDVGQTARAAMGPNDVLINIVDVTATDPGPDNAFYRPASAPIAVNAADANGQEGYEIPAAVIRGVRLHGHNLHMSVAFGTAPPSRAQVGAANRILGTLNASR